MLALLGACTPHAQTPKADSTAPPETVEERRYAFNVPTGFEGPWIEFATAEHGYGMFTKCGPSWCEAMLFSTEDGGRSWKGRTHPQPVAKNQQLYVANATTLVLLSEPDAWYISRDGAATWRRQRYQEGNLPPEYPRGAGTGPYYVDCGPAYDGPCFIKNRDRDASWRSELPAGAGTTLTNAPGPRIWLAGLRDGEPVTHVSEIGHTGLHEVSVPRQDGRKLANARVVISADGKDTWLIGDQEPSSGGGGSGKMRGSVVKATGLPLIWQLLNNVWVPRPTTAIKENPTWPYSVAPAGDGLLVLVGPEGAGYFQREWDLIGGLGELDWIGQTADGTLTGRSNSNSHAVFLSTGNGRDRNWIKVMPSRQ